MNGSCLKFYYFIILYSRFFVCAILTSAVIAYSHSLTNKLYFRSITAKTINMESRLSCNEITLCTKVAVLRSERGDCLPRARTLSFLNEIAAECPAIAAPPANVQRPTQTSRQCDDMTGGTWPEMECFGT